MRHVSFLSSPCFTYFIFFNHTLQLINNIFIHTFKKHIKKQLNNNVNYYNHYYIAIIKLLSVL